MFRRDWGLEWDLELDFDLELDCSSELVTRRPLHKCMQRDQQTNSSK